MRKTLIVFLALALVCACGAAVCTHAVAAPREDVTFDEHVFAGDPAAAAGLQVQLQAALQRNLFWDSTVRFSGRDYTVDTAFRFSPVAVSREQPRQYSGVEVDTRVNAWTSSDTNPFGYGRAYQEILDTLEPGQTGTKVIRVADYYDEYPLWFSVDLPHLFITTLDRWDDHDAYATDAERDAMHALRDFFRIPMLPDEYVELQIDKDMDGSSSSYGVSTVQQGDRYWPSSESVVTDDACFFRLSNRTENGKLVDMSRIPGGYGIYILPYVQSEADSFPDTYLCADQLACFFPLDPAVEIRHLGLTPDGSALALHTVENNIYYVTLIDVKTAAVLQKLAVMDDYTDEDYTNITETDEFTCIRVSERRICVLTQEADGQFQVALTSDFDSELPFAVGYSSISEMAFDGERLALVRNDETVLVNGAESTKRYLAGSTAGLITEDGTYVDNCGFTVAVFDASGLAYYGGYCSSLEGVNYINDTVSGSRQLVLPQSIRLSWEA